MSARRLLPLVVLNVIVSAAVVLGILFWWDSRQDAQPKAEAEVAVVPAAISTAVQQEAANSAPPEEEESADEPPSYTVTAGDTLGSISAQFDVSIEDIMTANAIDNPNFLQVGQVLIIPVGGLATAAPPTETPFPDEPPPPIATSTPPTGQVIVEIAEVVGVGQVDQEAVSIKNTGDMPIALLGWRLNDEDGRTYTFGQVTLFGDGAAINLHTGQGLEGPSDLYWGFDESIWRPGETVTLVDGEGQVRATFVVGSS